MSSIARIAKKRVEADVLVVGGGLAGLMAAIRAKDFVPRVILVDKAKVGKSGCSPFAAGIYNAVLPEDNVDLWMKEIIEAGDYISHQEWVKLHAEKSFSIVRLMDDWSRRYRLPIFEKDDSGRLLRRKSRGHVHSSHLVVNSLPMLEVLRRKAIEKGVELLERVMVTDILAHEGCAQGLVGFNYRTGRISLLKAKAVVLAAGGCRFKSIFVGHKNLTGDLQAAALRAGAVFKNFEQANSNTCYKEFDIHGMNLFVNVGGKFLNRLGQEFMWDYNPVLGNKALLSELSVAFCHEARAGRSPIYLDMTSAEEEDKQLCRKILPQTFKAFDRAGVDPFAHKLEWVPAFAGTGASIAGLDIDLQCQTSIPNLFAAGDMSCMPSDGAGLGGIPLAFASISGYVAGEAAARMASGTVFGGKEPVGFEEAVHRMIAPVKRTRGVCPDELIFLLQSLLFSYPVGYLKSATSLRHALEQLEEAKNKVRELKAANLHELVKANEVQSMMLIAEAFLRSSLYREESRAYHFREDFPRIDNRQWLKWVLLKRQLKGWELWTQDIPTPFHRPSEEFSLPRGVRRKG